MQAVSSSSRGPATVVSAVASPRDARPSAIAVSQTPLAPAQPRSRAVLPAPRRSAAAVATLRDGLIPRTGLAPVYVLDIEGTRLVGQNARFDVPMLSASESTGLTRLRLSAQLRNVVLPDGTHVASGQGSMTAILRGGRVAGLLVGSVSLSADSILLSRETQALTPNDMPVVLDRGQLAMQGGRAIGLAAGSTGTFAGLRIRAGDDLARVDVRDGGFIHVGDGSTILAAPSDRVVRVSGHDLAFRTDRSALDLDSGVASIRNGLVHIEMGRGRNVRNLEDPGVSHVNRDDFDNGRIVSRRDPRGQLFVSGISERDVDQGAVGDCWLLGSALAIAAMRPELLERLFTDNGDNTYGVRVFMGGVWRTATVDDDFYVHADTGRGVYAHSRVPGELWGPLLEKAHASVRAGGYQGMWAAGFPRDAFLQLTGMQSDVTAHDAVTDARLFEQLTRAARNRAPMAAVAGVPYRDLDHNAQLDRALVARNGLHNWHVYAVLGTQVEHDQQYVVLRNTSGDAEFRSDAYQADVVVDGRQRRDDGYFRMRIDDFRREFATTTTLRVQ